MNMFYGWVSNEPPILYYTCDLRRDISPLLPDRPIYRLRKLASAHSVEDLVAYHARAVESRPQDTLFYCVNYKEMADKLMAKGIPAYFISNNCFLDEQVFRILPETPKRFDAVYNARMTPVKRHALARRIARPLLIGGMATVGDTAEYFAQVQAEIPQGIFTHAEEPERYIPPAEIAKLLNQAQVGLCLSAKEGAMYAAAEYLLCGLPVVSTVSEGGRDEWFDSRYARVVPDDDQAIAAATEDLIRQELDPHFIRQKTIERMIEQRQTFITLLQTIFNAHQQGLDAARFWYTHFRAKLGRWRPDASKEVLTRELEGGWLPARRMQISSAVARSTRICV